MVLDRAGHGTRARSLASTMAATGGPPDTEPAPTGPDLSVLTRREREIVEHVRDGRTNRQIATAMGVSCAEAWA